VISQEVRRPSRESNPESTLNCSIGLSEAVREFGSMPTLFPSGTPTIYRISVKAGPKSQKPPAHWDQWPAHDHAMARLSYLSHRVTPSTRVPYFAAPGAGCQ